MADYLVQCKVCGQQVANSVKICPFCGKRRKMALWLKIVIGIIAIMVVPQAMSGFLQGSNKAASGSVSDTTGKTGTSGPASQITVDPRPEDQKQFEYVIALFSKQFDSAQNELEESTYRRGRMNDIKELAINTQINGWIGTLNQLRTNTEGAAYITIKLNNNLSIGTWNNALSDIGDNTLISMDSDLYKMLINMKTGQKVIFSGSFIDSKLDHFKEKSMTIRGSMKNPEFLMRFSNIARID